jgi:hypothetical protein
MERLNRIIKEAYAPAVRAQIMDTHTLLDAVESHTFARKPEPEVLYPARMPGRPGVTQWEADHGW